MLSLRFVPVAALAALVFLWCQARILRAARGIPAWRVREIVPLVICTGLAEGAGLALFFSQERPLLAWFALAVAARAVAWARYRAAAKSAALEYAGKGLLQAGTVGALVGVLAATYAAPFAWIAAVAVLATGWTLKFMLVTRASAYAGFSLPRLPVRGAR
jgi:phenylacetyl-CoA:acceptor oxidoreductase subunit 2